MSAGSAFSVTDSRSHEIALYREDNTVAVNTIQPIRGAHTGEPLQDNTFHEVYVGGDDLDDLIAALTKLRDTIIDHPSKESNA